MGGQEEPRLAELRRDAHHAQNCLDEKKGRKEEKQSTVLHNAALTMYKTVTHQRGVTEGKGVAAAEGALEVKSQIVKMHVSPAASTDAGTRTALTETRPKVDNAMTSSRLRGVGQDSRRRFRLSVCVFASLP